MYYLEIERMLIASYLGLVDAPKGRVIPLPCEQLTALVLTN